MLIWDLPTRLFHWLLAAAVTFCLWTGFSDSGALDWHMRSGQFVLGLLVFRLVWGVVGATYARFANFVRSPAAAFRYLANFRSAGSRAGHNPAGGLAVLAMLTLLLLQAGSGLFSSDDILYEGPLIDLVSSDTSALLTSLHKNNSLLVAAIVALHLLALLAHRVVRRDALVRPMFTGRTVAGVVNAAPTRWTWPSLLLAVATAGGVLYLVARVL